MDKSLKLGDNLPNEEGYYWMDDPETSDDPKIVEVVVIRGNAYALINDSIEHVAGHVSKKWGEEPIPQPV